MPSLMEAPYSYFADSNGAPLAGGNVYTYAAGTTTPKAAYTDSTGTVQLSNPVVLDSAGRAQIWLSGTYRIVVKDSLGNTIATADNVVGSSSSAQIPWAAAAGTSDAITATYNPANTALTDGLQLAFRATAANTTTTPTFSPDGLTAHIITQRGGAALLAGNINANLAEYILIYNLANTRWELLNPTIIPAVRRQIFTGAATYTPDTHLLYAIVELWGGGGGGGGVSGAAGQNMGAGGGAGGYSKDIFSAATIGASQAVTIGAAGTAGANTGGTGGTGGTTSLGSLLTAAGGVGGAGASTNTVSVLGGTGGAGTVDGVATRGAPGAPTVVGNGINGFVSGFGGSTSLGGGGPSVNSVSASAGNNGLANSGSGGGGASSGSGTAEVGGLGGSGLVIITEHCSQ